MALPNHHRGAYDSAARRITESASRPLTEAELALLRAELQSDPAGRGYAGADAATAADLLNNTYLVPNPDPAPPVPKRLSRETLLAHLTQPQAAAIANASLLVGEHGILTGIVNNDHVGLRDWVGLIHLAGMIDDATAGALLAEIAATEPDPDWPAEVLRPSRASLLFTTPELTIEPADITAARGA